MALVSTIHLHNVPDTKLESYASWFEGKHQSALSNLRGFIKAERYEVTEEQIMSMIPHPWRFMTVYDFDLTSPEIDVPALGPLLAEARDNGMISDDGTERIHTYNLLGDWKGSPNWQQDQPFSGISLILGNYVAGRYDEYQEWYEKVHSVEVTNVPGHVAMKRGELSPVQIEPRHYCPGDQLVLCGQQTDNLTFTIGDFSARAQGKSPSGIAMEPRSQSGSFARTVHYFKKVSGDSFWSGGVAYAGDLSAYPEYEK